MKLKENDLQKIIDFFSDKPVIKAYLFGSYVREQGKTDSDIDILVDLDYSQPIGLKFIQMQLDLEKIMGRKVDLVSSNGLSRYIKPIIEREKKLIYAR